VARRSGLRRRSTSAFVAPIFPEILHERERRRIAHDNPVDVGHRQRKSRALQQRAEFAHIGETARHAARLRLRPRLPRAQTLRAVR